MCTLCQLIKGEIPSPPTYAQRIPNQGLKPCCITKRWAQAQLREELNKDSRQMKSVMKRATAKVEYFKRYLKRRDGFVANLEFS